MLVFALTLAGAAGALLRFSVDRMVRARLGPHFPWGTFVINVSGSFALGLLIGAGEHHLTGPSIPVVFGIGLLGAYTTFSTFAVDTVAFLQRGEWRPALANVVLSLTCGLGAAALGILVGGVI
jgi:CrcB protein